MTGEQLRQTLLEAVRELATSRSYLNSNAVLGEAARRLQISGLQDQQALLTFFHDLFRSGYLAWGYNLSNTDPPNCHITERGRRALESLSRDPANPDGYIANLRAVGNLSPIAESYVREAVATYNSGCFKATAVMAGAAGESIILEVRDVLVNRLSALGHSQPAGLDDWRAKRVLDAIASMLHSKKKLMPHRLMESFEAYWPAFTQQIRVARNDAGHPTSLAPVDERLQVKRRRVPPNKRVQLPSGSAVRSSVVPSGGNVGTFVPRPSALPLATDL